jgi:hypothetical protein
VAARSAHSLQSFAESNREGHVSHFSPDQLFRQVHWHVFPSELAVPWELQCVSAEHAMHWRVSFAARPGFASMYPTLHRLQSASES